MYARGTFLHVTFDRPRRGLPSKGWCIVAVVCDEAVQWEVV